MIVTPTIEGIADRASDVDSVETRVLSVTKTSPCATRFCGVIKATAKGLTRRIEDCRHEGFAGQIAVKLRK
jgi:hypothetical protein